MNVGANFKMKHLLLYTIFFFQITFNLSGQIDVRHFDYSKADSIALSFPKKKYKSYTEFIIPLTQELHTDHEKFRVIFRWITDNIQYSYSNRTSDPDKIIKKGKCVCAGYASLLEAMCKSIGLECIKISGYSKTTMLDINRDYERSDHAWNGVKLYGNWYLVDATWAWGYKDSKTRKFKKHYDDTYFLTEPEFFYKNHLPEDKRDFLTEYTIKRKEFMKSPVYYSGLLSNGIKDIYPSKGEIKLRLKDSLEIKIQSTEIIDNFIIQFKQSRSSYQPIVEQMDGYYYLRHKFEQSGTFFMTIFANNLAIATYKLIIK